MRKCDKNNEINREKKNFLYKHKLNNIHRMPLGIEFNDSQKKSSAKILKIRAKMRFKFTTEITCDQHQKLGFVNNFVNGNNKNKQIVTK